MERKRKSRLLWQMRVPYDFFELRDKSGVPKRPDLVDLMVRGTRRAGGGCHAKSEAFESARTSSHPLPKRLETPSKRTLSR